MSLNKLAVTVLFAFSLYSVYAAGWSQTPGPRGANVISFAAKSTSVFYAGTFGTGFFVSTDAGLSWNPKNTGLTENGKYIFAILSDGSSVYAGTQEGVFMTSDNGDSWVPANNGIQNTIVSSLLKTGSKLYAGTGNGVFVSSDNGSSWSSAGFANFVNTLLFFNNKIYAGTSSGLYSTSDEGGSWLLHSGGITTEQSITGLMSIKNLLFAGSAVGIYQSADNGSSWITSNYGLDADYLYISDIVNNGSVIYTAVSGSGIFRLSNDGSRWLKVYSEPVAGRIGKLLASGSILLAGETTGIIRSVNKGSAWTSVNKGLNNLTPVSVACSNNKIFAAGWIGSTAIGLFRSTDDGSSWTDITNSIDNEIISLAVSGNKVFAGSQSKGLFMSTNSGNAWTASGDFEKVTAIAINNSDKNLIYAGISSGHAAPSGAVYRSVDNGKNWTNISGDFFNSPVLSIAAKDSYVFAGTPAGLYVSSNKGNTWLLAYPASGIISVQKTGNRVYAVKSSGGVILSNNNGSTWADKNNGITDLNITSLSAIYGDYAYTGTHSGIFFTSNAGASWSLINQGLSSTDVVSLAGNDSYVFAGITEGRVWKKNQVGAADNNSVTDSKWNSAPGQFALYQNYPNPFNPSTSIKFDIPSSGNVSLIVYDMQGREVTQLVNGYTAAGSYDVSWNASDISSGIYIYKLVMNSFTAVRKMTLIK